MCINHLEIDNDQGTNEFNAPKDQRKSRTDFEHKISRDPQNVLTIDTNLSTNQQRSVRLKVREEARHGRRIAPRCNQRCRAN